LEGGQNPEVDQCIEACVEFGFKFAGLQPDEAGNVDCRCGNDYGQYESADNCETCATSGISGGGKCGGTLSNSVYGHPPSNDPSNDFPEWQIEDAAFNYSGTGDGVGNSLIFAHGVGDSTTEAQTKIYSFPANSTSTDNAGGCYSHGGIYVGTLGKDNITGLAISDYENTVSAGETSFNFTFGSDIDENVDIYSATEDENGTKVATIRFCVMLELLRPNVTDDAELVLVNYAEYAFSFLATLSGNFGLEDETSEGSIGLVDAFRVEALDPTSEAIPDDTYAVEAYVCGPGDFVEGGILNQGDSVHICVNSTSYPEASVSGIDSLTFTAPLDGDSGSVVLEAIIGGISVDELTKFDATVDCADGDQCIVRTQLQGIFYPPNGSMNVTITGKATMKLGGGRRVLVDIVPGDRSLQEATSKSSFSIDVETTASDTSGTTKGGVATSILMTILAAASLRFF
jgi:hypothetical protein